MKTIYLDFNFMCHISGTETMQAVETEIFDSMSDIAIECYRFVPEGQEWTKPDGSVIHGPFVQAVKDPIEEENKHKESEAQALVRQIKELLGVDDNSLLVTKVRYNMLTAQGVDEVYSVYVQTNEDGYVTAVDSDAFIDDPTLWVKIDEGTGDMYHYAKNQYCKYGVTASDGTYNYKLVRGRVVYMPQTPVAPTPTVEERLNDIETALCEILDILSEM